MSTLQTSIRSTKVQANELSKYAKIVSCSHRDVGEFVWLNDLEGVDRWELESKERGAHGVGKEPSTWVC